MVKEAAQFYKDLGAKGLAARKMAEHTRKELNYLKKILSKKNKILDLACGYGRFTIALAKQGYQIEGIDISPNLLKDAKSRANSEKVHIKFRQGDMRYLPYKDNTFDTIICMWSAFIELHKKRDQVKAIKEMNRVLTEEGFALLEMSKPSRISERFKKGRYVVSIIDGVEANPMYRHNKTTLKELMQKTKIKKYKIFIDNFGGRERLFLQFWKNG